MRASIFQKNDIQLIILSELCLSRIRSERQ